MRINTEVAILSAAKDKVFAYLSDIKNLPRWATEFCQDLKVEGGRYKVHTCSGEEVFFRMDANRETGTIDMFAGPTEEQMGVYPTRVVALPGGRSAYIFTMFQGPGMDAEAFEAQAQSLRREFVNIEKHFATHDGV